MNKQQYEDYKYVMQDTYQIYLGSKYTFGEIVENEEIPFKFRLLVERYVYQEVDPSTTLESQIYYLEPKGMVFHTYKHIRMKVKVNVLKEKRTLKGRKWEYTTQILPIEKLAEIPPAKKEEMGMVIQEILCSKLALMTF